MPGISSISEIKTAVSVLIAGVPANVVDYVVRNAIRRFLVESMAWRETINIKTTLDDDDAVNVSYALTLTNDEAFIIRIMDVWQIGEDGRKVRPSVSPLDYIYDRTSGTIVFDQDSGRPSEAGLDYAVEVSIAPKLTSDDVPTYLMERWTDGFVAGSCADLLEIPGRPWSDMEGSQYWRARELGYLNRAAQEMKAKGTSRNPTISA